MASVLANLGAAIGSELIGNAAFGGVDQIGKKKPKSFGNILKDTFSDPINYIPFGGLIKGLFTSKKIKGSKKQGLIKG